MNQNNSLANISGFTPVFDEIADEYGLVTAAIFGVVWRHCQMNRHVCDASLDTLAEKTGVSYKTVKRALDRLCQDNLITDLTPKLRHKPHTYTIASGFTLEWHIGAKIGRTESPTSDSTNGGGGRTESPTRWDRESDLGRTESPIKIPLKKQVNKHHHDARKIEKESPEEKPPDDGNDDDGFLSLYEKMDSLGYDRPGQLSVIESRRSDLDALSEELATLIGFFESGGKYPAWVKDPKAFAIAQLRRPGAIIGLINQQEHRKITYGPDHGPFETDEKRRAYEAMQAQEALASRLSPHQIEQLSRNGTKAHVAEVAEKLSTNRKGLTDSYLEDNAESIDRKLKALHRS